MIELGDRQEAAYRVRDFGNDREYESIEELVEGLLSHYRGRSVAVHVKGGRYGMVRSFFVDVSQNGEISETYGDVPKRPVDINIFRQAAMA